jgi:hypothetical protein
MANCSNSAFFIYKQTLFSRSFRNRTFHLLQLIHGGGIRLEAPLRQDKMHPVVVVGLAVRQILNKSVRQLILILNQSVQQLLVYIFSEMIKCEHLSTT